MSLDILKERLAVHHVKVLDELPKNHKHSFKLDLLVVKQSCLSDLATIDLPSRVKAAMLAHLYMREDGDRFVIRLYSK